MAKIRIMTDSASDISAENEKKYDILILPFKMAMGNETYLGRVDLTNEELYKKLDEYDGIPSTSQITIFEYLDVFTEQYKNGYTDVINVTIISKGSPFNFTVLVFCAVVLGLYSTKVQLPTPISISPSASASCLTPFSS